MSHDPGDHWKPEAEQEAMIRAIWRVLTTNTKDIARLVREVADLARRVGILERRTDERD